MVRLSPAAEAQFDRLLGHYESLHRDKAVENLVAAVEQAWSRISAAPLAGLKAPRPYPTLKKAGRLWVKQGIYWISYRPAPPMMITGIFHEAVNIPRWVYSV